MEIKCLSLGELQTNCYLLSSEKGAVVIDPAVYSLEVENFLRENIHKQRLILITHAHFDHYADALRLSKVTDTKIGIGALENSALSDGNVNLSSHFGNEFEHFSADLLFEDNQEFSVGDIDFKVLHTPGHTKGSICYLCEDNLFSGDLLFRGSIGRTDFPGGSFEELKKSVRRLYATFKDINIFSGHGEKTTLLYEKSNNPFIRG